MKRFAMFNAALMLLVVVLSIVLPMSGYADVWRVVAVGMLVYFGVLAIACVRDSCTGPPTFTMSKMMWALVPLGILLAAINPLRQHGADLPQIMFLVVAVYYFAFGTWFALAEGWRGLLRAAVITLFLLLACAFVFAVLSIVFRLAFAE